MSDCWLEIDPPRRGPIRNCSIALGWRPLFTFEVALDTGYEASRFEYTFWFSVGPWRYTFDWRPYA